MKALPAEVRRWINEIRDLTARLSKLRAKLAEWHQQVGAELAAAGVPQDEASMKSAYVESRGTASATQRRTQSEMVLSVLHDSGGAEMDVASILRAVRQRGFDVAEHSVRTYLSAAVRRGLLERTGRGRYRAKTTESGTTK